jgi:hypothetical protein
MILNNQQKKTDFLSIAKIHTRSNIPVTKEHNPMYKKIGLAKDTRKTNKSDIRTENNEINNTNTRTAMTISGISS